ncbi:MAG: hypothetical protein J6K05_08645 [Bacteroidaceae bacterium]|nr:hypothetical protein [Bacteroidaceae bacterium]
MKHWSLYISHTLMALLIIALASCSDTDYLGAPSEGDATEVYVSVMLNVNGGSTDTRTRATITPDGVGDDNTPDISMQDGLDYEENIDPNDIDLLLFTRGNADNGGDGTFVARVNLWHYWTSQGDLTNEPDRSYQYQIMGYVENSAITLGNEYQLMAICNMGVKKDNGHLYTTISDGETIYNSDYNEENLKGKTRDEVIRMLTFRNYQANFTQALTEGKARIPMWGIKSVTLKKEGNNFGMDVLRAMAKVKVTMSDELYSKGYRFTWAGMTKVNTGGFIVAQDNMAITSSSEGTVTTAYNNTTDTPINKASVPTGVGTGEWFDFHEIAQHKSHVIYVPEFSNQGITGTDENGYSLTSAIRLQIMSGITDSENWDNAQEVTFNNKYPQIYFTDYSTTPNPSASTWDIIRNDFYDFTITAIEDGALQARVRVTPWEYETMEYELSQNAGITLTCDPQAVYTSKGYTNETVYSSDEADYATFTFTVTEPKGVRWVAHLEDHYNFDITGDTYGYGGETDSDGQAKVYTLRVKPRHAYQNGTTYTTELYFTIETLLGTTANISYPASEEIDDSDYGIAKNKISITQVGSKTSSSTEESEENTVE